MIGNAADCAHWTGEWNWALEETNRVLATDLDRSDRSFLLTGVIQIQSWRGNRVVAELEEMAELVVGLDDPETLSAVHATRIYPALALGQFEAGRKEAHEASRLSPLNAPLCSWFAAHASLWLRDAEGASSDLASLEGTHAHGPVVKLHKTTIRAGIAALEGRTEEALDLYRDALQGWRDTGLPVLEALTGIDMATLLNPALPEVQTAAASAREIFGRLGARPFLERLDVELARTASLPTDRKDLITAS